MLSSLLRVYQLDRVYLWDRYLHRKNKDWVAKLWRLVDISFFPLESTAHQGINGYELSHNRSKGNNQLLHY